MTARARPEDIEYRNRLKWGTVFQYTTREHSIQDIVADNYFHTLSQRYLMPGDEIHVAVLHSDGSWHKAVFEVTISDLKRTLIEQISDWRQSFGEASDAGDAPLEPTVSEEADAAGPAPAPKTSAPKKQAAPKKRAA